jgi:Putative auto-transporter adhesin, head GIN domain
MNNTISRQPGLFALTILTSCLASWALPGCNIKFMVPAIQGNGVLASQQRNLRDFDSVDVGSAFEVEIITGEDFDFKLSIDENLMSLIETKVVDGKLIIRSSQSYSTNLIGKIEILMPTITAFSGSGATSSTIANVKADQFTVELSGASKLVLKDTVANTSTEAQSGVEQLKVAVSGASKFDGSSLPCNQVKAEASGASSIIVQVNQSIDASASGASTIRYLGDGELRTERVSGAAKISRQ